MLNLYIEIIIEPSTQRGPYHLVKKWQVSSSCERLLMGKIYLVFCCFPAYERSTHVTFFIIPQGEEIIINYLSVDQFPIISSAKEYSISNAHYSELWKLRSTLNKSPIQLQKQTTINVRWFYGQIWNWLRYQLSAFELKSPNAMSWLS